VIFYKLYLLLGLLELTLELLEIQVGVFAVKPLLMPILFWAAKGESSMSISLKRLVLWALFFSWVGDVSLLFESAHKIFFVLGLLGFLSAHFMYISCLGKTIDFRQLKSFKGQLGTALMVGLLVLLMTYFELKGNSTYTGFLRIAVPMYSIVLGFLVVLSANQLNSKTPSGILLFSGALLFMLSDMLIALSKFSSSLNFMSDGLRSFFIMLTYILAQLLIVRSLSTKTGPNTHAYLQ